MSQAHDVIMIDSPGDTQRSSYDPDIEEFLAIYAEDECNEWQFCFRQEDNPTVCIDDDVMTLIRDLPAGSEDEPEEVRVRLLAPMSLEPLATLPTV